MTWQIILGAFLVILTNTFYYGLGQQKGFKDGINFVVKIGKSFDSPEVSKQIQNISTMGDN